MALMEKLEALTLEQRETFNSIATEQELDTFLGETDVKLTAEEKAAVWRHIRVGQTKLGDVREGKASLTDEELGSVAGGGCGGKPAYWEMAYEDGRRILFDSFDGIIIHGSCGCGMDTMKESTFAREMNHNTGYLENWIYWDCKCYACGKTLDYIYVSRTN